MSDEFGPAMAALNERQRSFVMAMIEFPGISFADAARRAGYSDVADGAKVRGHYCAHNPTVQAAIREEASKRLNAASLTAANVLMSLLTDEGVEPKDRIKAAGMLLDRSGFGAAQTINVNKHVTDNSGKAVMERIEKAAAVLGIDPETLLGVQPMKVISNDG
jgi:phage terminase small subunit